MAGKTNTFEVFCCEMKEKLAIVRVGSRVKIVLPSFFPFLLPSSLPCLNIVKKDPVEKLMMKET